MPGYSGLFANPMLTHGLVLSRDLLLSGAAAQAIDTPDRAAQSFGDVMPASQDMKAVRRLQSNVRAALCEMELLEGLRWVRQSRETKDAPADIALWARNAAGNERALVKLSAPDLEVFQRQLLHVQSYADLRAERVNEILTQVVPQTASWSALAGLTPERHRYTWEMLGIGLRFAMLVCMRIKQTLGCPRPMEYSPTVQPIILTPGYTAYPSGHATESYFVAEFLPLLAGSSGTTKQSLRAQLHRLAFRIAENRVVAGLHFPIDSVAGHIVGHAVARYMAWRCGLASIRPRRYADEPVGYSFTPSKSSGALTLLPRLDTEVAAITGIGNDATGKLDLTLLASEAPTLCQLAKEACSEW